MISATEGGNDRSVDVDVDVDPPPPGRSLVLSVSKFERPRPCPVLGRSCTTCGGGGGGCGHFQIFFQNPLGSCTLESSQKILTPNGPKIVAVPIFGISYNIKVEVAWVDFSRLKAFIFDALHSTRLAVPAHSFKATLH